MLTLLVPLSARAWITFERTYGGLSGEEAYSVDQTLDGGYIIVGQTGSFGIHVQDVYLVRTDSLGDTVWTRNYGRSDYSWGESVEQTEDGGYIIVGSSQPYGGYSDVYLIKTDESGDSVWTHTYSHSDYDFGYSVKQTEDGGYIIVASTRPDLGYYDVYLIKTDALGDTAWTRTYGGPEHDAGRSVVQTEDAGYIIAGYTESFGIPSYPDIYLVKTDSLGDTLWTRTYGGSDDEHGESVEHTLDGGYIIAGDTRSFGAGGVDFYLVKTDSLGDTLWTRTYGGSDDEHGESVEHTLDGGYIMTGETRSFGAGEYDFYLVKTDSLGDTLWTRTYGASSYDEAYSVKQTSDGGYVIAGHTESMGAGGSDFYLIKADPNGLVGVNYPPDLVDQPDTTVAENQYLTFTLEATDPNGDSIWFASPDMPEGAALNSLTGVFWWTPTYAQSGLYTVTFIATDMGSPALSDTEQTDITVTDVVRVAGDEDALRPVVQYLAQNRPNPFSSVTTVSYSLRSRQPVRIAVYDIRGALVRELVHEPVAAGVHRVSWDGRDGRGRQVGSGVYFCRMEAGEFTETRRMVLLR